MAESTKVQTSGPKTDAEAESPEGAQPGAAKEDGSSSAALYTHLRDALLHGGIVGGTLLLESALGKKHDMSRTPVREALLKLEQDGLVDRETRGYRVRTGSAEEILAIYDVRIRLEALAANLAANQRSEFDLAKLAHLTEEDDTMTDAERHERHSQWHQVVWNSARNPVLVEALVRLTSQLKVYETSAWNTQNTPDEAKLDHERVVQAIVDRDEDAAERLMTEHLQRTKELRLSSLARI